MNILFLQASRLTPEVRLNTDERALHLIGRSSPENALTFFQPVYDSVDEYFKEKDVLQVNMMFEYFNTSSSKCLFTLFKQMQRYHGKGKKVIINWYYEEEDEDMYETGEDFAMLLDIDIDFFELPEGESIAEFSNS